MQSTSFGKDMLRATGLTRPQSSSASPCEEPWQCDLCAKVFGSSRALAMHASREHGYRKRVRFYASGDTCPVCCQLFHTRQRLSIHFKKMSGVTQLCRSTGHQCHLTSCRNWTWQTNDMKVSSEEMDGGLPKRLNQYVKHMGPHCLLLTAQRANLCLTPRWLHVGPQASWRFCSCKEENHSARDRTVLVDERGPTSICFAVSGRCGSRCWIVWHAWSCLWSGQTTHPVAGDRSLLFRFSTHQWHSSHHRSACSPQRSPHFHHIRRPVPSVSTGGSGQPPSCCLVD